MKRISLNRYSLMTFPLAGTNDNPIMKPEETIRLTSAAGLHQVDLLNVSSNDISVYQNICKQYHVQVHCLTGYIPFLDRQCKIKDLITRELEKAAALNAPLFMIVPYLPFFDYERASILDHDEIRSQMIAGFNLAVELAVPYNIRVCFETTPHDISSLSGNTDCKEVLDAVPGLGLAFDSANMLPHGDQTLEAFSLLQPYIIHVHLKDVALINPTISTNTEFLEKSFDGHIMQGVMHGTGCIPLQELCYRLEQSGYTGSYAIEYVPPEKADDFNENLKQIKKFLNHTTTI